MRKIKFIKATELRKEGDIVEAGEKSAESYISNGFAVYFEEEQKANTPESAKLGRDAHVLEYSKVKSKELAVAQLGVDPDNFDKIKGKPTEEFKCAARIFNSKIDMAEKFYETQPVYFDEAGLFWLWNNGLKCWKMHDETDISNYLYLSQGIDTVNSKQRNEIMQALKQVGRMYRPKPIPKTWIQFKNGIIDVKDPTIQEATKDYFTVNPIPWNLGECGDTPTIDRIFTEWVGAERAKTLYQILSYCLLSDYPLHRIFCFIGSGMNGKSKFLELLRHFVGCENVTATELDVLLSSRFEVTRLYKKLVCQMGETNFSEMNKTSILKKLSGGDMIGYEYKGKTPFEDMNYAKIIISTNNLPTTSDKTIGFYRRWLIIDFPNQFTEKKDILADIPEKEYENLAFKCVSILRDLLEKKEFHNEGTIEERMKKYEDHSDPLEKFLKLHTVEDVDGFIWKFEFEKRLNAWLKENRFREISETSIGTKMKTKGILQELRQADWFTDGIQKRFRAWIGVKWVSESSVNADLNNLNNLNRQSSLVSHVGEGELGKVVQVVQVVQNESSVNYEVTKI